VNPVVGYTLARSLLFLASAGVLYLLQLRGVWLLLGAIVVSGLASYALLSRQRDAMSAAVAERVERTRRRIDEGAGSEDED
jgi:hypothetical protein